MSTLNNQGLPFYPVSDEELTRLPDRARVLAVVEAMNMEVKHLTFRHLLYIGEILAAADSLKENA